MSESESVRIFKIWKVSEYKRVRFFNPEGGIQNLKVSELPKAGWCQNFLYLKAVILCSCTMHVVPQFLFQNSDTFCFLNYPLPVDYDSFQIKNRKSLRNSDTFRILKILTLSNSDTFKFWHFRDLKGSSTFRFWHIYFLTPSDSDAFRFEMILTHSGFEKFWHFPVLTHSLTFQILTPSGDKRFWQIQILTLSSSENIYTLRFRHLCMKTESTTNMGRLIKSSQL